MNANHIINMITRIFVRKAVNGGIRAGLNALSTPDSAGRGEPRPRQSQDARQNAKRAKQATRMMRRASKF